MSRQVCIALNGMLLLALGVCLPAKAEDFRIDSKVFSGKEKEPVSQSTTLFRAGVVYDYLTEPKKVAVFDKQRGRFILLDPQRRLKTEVETAAVLKFTAELHQLAAAGPAYIKNAADPKFETEIDAKTNELVMTSPSLTYRLTTVKANSPEAADQYREFSDWYVRLNAMTNPGSNPPFARLLVNEELARRGSLAEQVQLNIPRQFQTGGREMTLRSEHQISWRLLQRDFDLIAETAQQLVTFDEVSFAEYRTTKLR